MVEDRFYLILIPKGCENEIMAYKSLLETLLAYGSSASRVIGAIAQPTSAVNTPKAGQVKKDSLPLVSPKSAPISPDDNTLPPIMDINGRPVQEFVNERIDNYRREIIDRLGEQVTIDPSRQAAMIGERNQLTQRNKQLLEKTKISDPDEYDEYNVQEFLQKTSNRFMTPALLDTKIKGRSLSDSEMREMHDMLNLWSTSGISAARTLDNFNRFYACFPDMELSPNLKSYIFITRPDFNIEDALAVDNATVFEMNKTHPEILKWCTSNYSDQHELMPYLQSRATSLQLPDYQIRDSEFMVPFFGYKYKYPTVTNESTTGGTFDITFREDNQLRITKFFRFWTYYMDCINKGILTPTKENIKNGEYDYMCSVYEFICDPTSEWILWYSKYTGCFPTGVPVSNLSYSLGDSVDGKIGITFTYIRVEHMEPSILTDFASNIKTSDTNYLDLYNSDFDITASSMSACPVLVRVDNKMLLKWLPMADGPSTGLVTADGHKFSPYDNNFKNAVNAFASTKKIAEESITAYSEAYKERVEQWKAHESLTQSVDSGYRTQFNKDAKLETKAIQMVDDALDDVVTRSALNRYRRNNSDS